MAPKKQTVRQRMLELHGHGYNKEVAWAKMREEKDHKKARTSTVFRDWPSDTDASKASVPFQYSARLLPHSDHRLAAVQVFRSMQAATRAMMKEHASVLGNALVRAAVRRCPHRR